MDLNKKNIIENFIKNNNDDENINLILEKLNDFLSSFLYDITLKTNNSVNFGLNLIGDYLLSSNFSKNNFVHILINYYTNENDYDYSENRAKKGPILKLTNDAFNIKKNIIPTINQLTKLLYDELTIKLQNSKVYIRKNCIGLTLLGYKFCIFFINFNKNQKEQNFILQSKNYTFNFDILHENLLIKNQETKGNFFNLVKFFKATELELINLNKLNYKASNTLYFYENLIYNIPNELLLNEYIYDNFIASVSYLKNIDLDDLNTADNLQLVNDSYNLYSKPAITSINVKTALKQFDLFLINLDKIFSI